MEEDEEEVGRMRRKRREEAWVCEEGVNGRR